ncbi:hypothetical protein P3W85_08875 [Cupriavidus basilensis]|uniref:Uncharacterized protein n=1 Tax=Cupriavidus basilensis TaxID=68895 RepID=A0ABT6AKC8_9BURK|nr:hypothetical protein [Cupriavidus basilensis]MDF3833060.1 hypothetical protein [Cupriavidus basilensis]
MKDHLIANVLERLRSDIAAVNIGGNVEGLLARHVVGSDQRVQIRWGVDCDDVWLQRSYDPSSLPSVAALGYTLAFSPQPRYAASLEEGIQRATARDPSMAGHGAALHDPAVLIGLVLAARELRSTKPQYLAWCGQVVRGLAQGASTRLDPLLAYAASLCEIDVGRPQFDPLAPLNYCAALDWWWDQGAGRETSGPEQRQALRATVLERALAEVTGSRSAHQAALLWRTLRVAISEEAGTLLQSSSTAARLLDQFESCLRRWRWDAADLRVPVRWLIRSEREVQDILWVILRSTFPDLEDEDTLPKFGHSTYRADLGIPSLGLLIEVKFARAAADFKTIEKEVLEDIVPYLRSPERYNEVLVFIYDDSCSVQEHETTRQALRSVKGIVDVIVVSRPSHLPSSGDRQSWEQAMSATKR